MEIDGALVKAARQGDESARNKIITSFKSKIEQCARKYYLSGGERSDLTQEGYIGLAQAIERFDEAKGDFVSFAMVCVGNSIKNSIKQSQSLKNRALNESLPFESAAQSDLQIDSPEELYLQKESQDILREAIHQALTPLEREAVLLFMNGYDYGEIGRTLNKDAKAVDNALTRAKAKLGAALKEKR